MSIVAMSSVLACFTRTEKSQEESLAAAAAEKHDFLTKQLKFTRDQLAIQSQQCKQLESELRQLKEQQRQAIQPEELETLREEHRQELERLNQELASERDLHREAAKQLQSQRDAKVQELREELRTLSDGLAQKEEDMLNIQFSMVELQNRCNDQGALVEENADAFQKASEELAEKEEALEDAIQRQQELRQQMNAASAQLQDQVAHLSKELEQSQAAAASAQASERRLREENAALVARVRQVTDAMEALRESKRVQEAGAEQKVAQLEEQIQGLVQLVAQPPQAVDPQPEDSHWSTPTFPSPGSPGGSPELGPERGSGGLEGPMPLVPSILIAAEIDLGGSGPLSNGGLATLTVSPWQTSSDYNSVVKEFLASHQVKSIFEKAVVLYLEDLEKNATTFPLVVKATLADIYSRYG